MMNKPNAHKKILAHAAIVTILFHILLVILFKTSEKDTSVTPLFVRDIAMITLDNQDIVETLKYGDPTLIAKPYKLKGYAKLSTITRNKVENALVEFTYKKSYKFNVEKFTSFKEKSIMKLWNEEFVSLPIKKQVTLVAIPDKFPILSNEKGTKLIQIFDNIKQIQDSVKKNQPKQATILTVAYVGESLLPRIKVLQSSGSMELDKIAVVTFCKRWRELKIKLSKTGVTHLFKVKWTKGQY